MDAPVRDQAVQFKDVGTHLSVRPTISDDGNVTLEVAQEVNAATAEVAFDAPVISTRTIQARAAASSGDSRVRPKGDVTRPRPFHGQSAPSCCYQQHPIHALFPAPPRPDIPSTTPLRRLGILCEESIRKLQQPGVDPLPWPGLRLGLPGVII